VSHSPRKTRAKPWRALALAEPRRALARSPLLGTPIPRKTAARARPLARPLALSSARR